GDSRQPRRAVLTQPSRPGRHRECCEGSAAQRIKLRLPEGSPSELAIARKMRLSNSFAGLDDFTHGFEDGVNVNLEHGRMGVVSATVSGHYVGSAENNVLGIPAIRGLRRGCRASRVAIWTVSRRICWAEQGYDWRVYCNCEVKR